MVDILNLEKLIEDCINCIDSLSIEGNDDEKYCMLLKKGMQNRCPYAGKLKSYAYIQTSNGGFFGDLYICNKGESKPKD